MSNAVYILRKIREQSPAAQARWRIPHRRQGLLTQNAKRTVILQWFAEYPNPS